MTPAAPSLLISEMCHEPLRSLLRPAEPGVPVLLKQYLKAGGRLLAVNVDQQFSNAIDALIVVDPRQALAAVLDRYMGKDQAATFRAWHAMRA